MELKLVFEYHFDFHFVHLPYPYMELKLFTISMATSGFPLCCKFYLILIWNWNLYRVVRSRSSSTLSLYGIETVLTRFIFFPAFWGAYLPYPYMELKQWRTIFLYATVVFFSTLSLYGIETIRLCATALLGTLKATLSLYGIETSSPNQDWTPKSRDSTLSLYGIETLS